MSGEPIFLRPISSGLDLSRRPSLIAPGATPDCQNVDFDRDSVKSSQGIAKFGNQVAPRPGIQTGPDTENSKLPVLYGKSAPLMGYAVLPWRKDQDIGGDFAVARDLGQSDNRLTWNFSSRRGRSFALKVSFRIPEEEKLYAAPTLPANWNAAGALATRLGADSALDEFFAIAQKGGDRTTPMSWALGVVNTGDLLDIDADGIGNNILGVPTSQYEKRVSNYALCFLWLDAAQWGQSRPSQMRYLLSNGTVDEGETGASSYSTMAYRAVLVPFFVEPGRNYHVELGVGLDSGSVGSGRTPTAAFNEDGSIVARVAEGLEASQEFKWAQGALTQTLFRWKGPLDSLEYLAKWGVRYSGKDETHLGLGYRCLPWMMAGNVPAGIDAAPLESGGFAIVDHSSHDIVNYDEFSTPDVSGSSRFVVQALRIGHATGSPDLQTNAEGISYGMGTPASAWGMESSLWTNVAPFGKHPFGIHDLEWTGLGGRTSAALGFNTEALRGYRIVIAKRAGGSNNPDLAAGGIISIGTVVHGGGGIYAAGTITPEVLPFVDQTVAFGPTTGKAGPYEAVLQAFRWRQRRLVLSDFRVYDGPRDYRDGRAEFSLNHETLLELESGLQAWWPLSDGGGGRLEERVAGNDGVLAPFSLAQVPAGLEGELQTYFSGEGERTTLALGLSQAIKEAFREALKDGKSGCAVELKLRIPGATYGIPRKIAGTAANGDFWEAKFAPSYLWWGVDNPELVDAASGMDYGIGGGSTVPPALLEFGSHVHLPQSCGDSGFGDGEPFMWPIGFDLKVPGDLDEKGTRSFVPGITASGTTSVSAWYYDTPFNVSRYGIEAGWIGKTFTVQVGLSPTGTEDEYDCYLAYTPSDWVKGSAGYSDPGGEFQWKRVATIRKRNLERLSLLVGGVYSPFEQSWCDYSARMFLDSARVFATSAPGAISNGPLDVPRGTGKLLGGEALPQRALTEEDILVPVLGNGTVLTTARSRYVTAGGADEFSTLDPEDSAEAVRRTLLVIDRDTQEKLTPQNLAEEQPDLYFVVEATTSRLTLGSPYRGGTKTNAAAHTLRLVGYGTFEDDLELKPLPLVAKNLNGYATGITGLRSYLDWWTNDAPIGVNWAVTVLSPRLSGHGFDVHPSWVRGAVESRDNPILGLHSLNETVFAASQGSLFEGDDRWRFDGPSESLEHSLEFRAREGVLTGLSFPAAGDRLVFQGDITFSLYDFTLAALSAANYKLIDCWVKVESYRGLQTIAWFGSEETDPARLPNTHVLAWWVRLNEGHPELCIGSEGTINSSRPFKGLFVARADVRVPRSQWTHIRWYIPFDSGVTFVPTCAVQGKPVESRVYGTEDGRDATLSEWLTSANASQWEGASFVLGCARDGEPMRSDPEGSIGPTWVQGWMHPLAGRLCGFVMGYWLSADPGARDPQASFNPITEDYAGITVTSRILEAGGVHGLGHLVADAAPASARVGVLHSSPFVSLSHELGDVSARPSFATAGREVFVANGGRVAIVEDGAVRKAGLIAPQYLPQFRAERRPCFELNRLASSGDTTDNDAIKQLTSTGTDLLTYHYRFDGGSYLTQIADTGMNWARDYFFVFSCLIRPLSVSGRIPLFSRRQSLESGGCFVEIRDGYVWFGWWDTSLKREVAVRTDRAVMRPGFIYYVYARKWFPRGGVADKVGFGCAASSNWQNQHFAKHQNPGGVAFPTFDMLVVREFPQATPGDTFDGWTGWDAKAAIAYPSGGGTWTAQGSSTRSCISFMLGETDDTVNTVGLTVRGYVTRFDATLGDADEIIVAAIAGNGTDFLTLDHTGMLVQIVRKVSGLAADSNKISQIFRIVEIKTRVRMRVVDVSGASPGFDAGTFPADTQVVIFPGAFLVKEGPYDNSRAPDCEPYPVELFGTSLALNPLNGLKNFEGFVYGAKWHNVTTATGTDKNVNPEIFMDPTGGFIVSAAEIGVDEWGTQDGTPATIMDLPHTGRSAGQLFVTGSRSRSCFDCRTGGASTTPVTSQPNADLQVTVDATRSIYDEHLFFAGATPAEGLRRIVLQFFDPKNNVRSAPSDVMTVDPSKGDVPNTIGLIRFRLENLPRSPDRRENLEVEVYQTLADGEDFFFVASTRADAKEIEWVVNDVALEAFGSPLDSTALAPPRAAIVSLARSCIWYANFPEQVDGIAFSRPFQGEIVPASQVATIDTGDRDAVTGMHPLGNEMIVFKRQSIHPCQLVLAPDGSLALSEEIPSRGDGAVSSQSIVSFEGRLYFISDRGPHVLVVGQRDPIFIGQRILDYLAEHGDPDWLVSVSAAVNRARSQFVFTVKRRDERVALERFGIEFEQPAEGVGITNPIIAGHRFSFYREPAVTALGSVVSKTGGPARLIGGTADGFLVWMDEPSSVRSLISSPEIVAPTAGPGGALTGVANLALEGWRGAVIRWLESGVVKEARILTGATDALGAFRVVDDEGELIVPLAGSALSLGLLLHRWSTKEVDAETPWLEKLSIWLDVSRSLGTGRLAVDLFRNQSETPMGMAAIDLTLPYFSEDIGRHLQEARSVRALFRTDGVEPEQRFELYDLCFRMTLADNR